jgi:hypothetical protein
LVCNVQENANGTTRTILACGSHSWPTRPHPAAVLDHMRAFTDALARTDLDEAFRLCPVLEKKELLTPKDAPKWFARHLPDLLFTYVDPLNTDDPRDLDAATRDAWLRSLRQPRKATTKQLALVVPAEGTGEVLVNLAVGGEFGNLTLRFALEHIGAHWVLCFGDIDMM